MSIRIIITVPEEFAEISSKILIYFTQILNIPKIIDNLENGSIEGMIFTTEELENLESIIKEVESLTSSIIINILININPKSEEIKEIIDFQYINHHHRIFYLARMIDGIYY